MHQQIYKTNFRNTHTFNDCVKSFLDEKNKIQEWMRANNFHEDADLFGRVMENYVITQQDYHKIATRYDSEYDMESLFPKNQFPAHKVLIEIIRKIDESAKNVKIAPNVISMDNNKYSINKYIMNTMEEIHDFTGIINNNKLPEPRLISKPQGFDDKITNFQEVQKCLVSHLKKNSFPDSFEFNKCCNEVVSNLKNLYKNTLRDNGKASLSKDSLETELDNNQKILDYCFLVFTNINHSSEDKDERKHRIKNAALKYYGELKENHFAITVNAGKTGTSPAK